MLRSEATSQSSRRTLLRPQCNLKCLHCEAPIRSEAVVKIEGISAHKADQHILIFNMVAENLQILIGNKKHLQQEGILVNLKLNFDPTKQKRY